FARAVTTSAGTSGSGATSTLSDVSGRGWQSGISSAVRLPAITPAISAAARTSPFGLSPGRACASVSRAMCTRPRAPGSRAVAGLALTSTMRALPSASRCESLSAKVSALHQARHDLDQVAGPMPAVQLPADHLVPPVLAGAVGARQRENERALGDAGAGARLQGRESDALIADLVNPRSEAVDLLLEQGPERFGRYITAGQARPAGRDDDIDIARLDPVSHLRANVVDGVYGPTAGGEFVPIARDAVGQ